MGAVGLNIKDTKPRKPRGDKLEWLLRQQEEAFKHYGTTEIDLNINDARRQAVIRSSSWDVVEEMAEAAWAVAEAMAKSVNLLKNRPWVKNQTEVDVEHVCDEVADTWIFFIKWTELMLGKTCDAAELVNIIERKRAVNDFRRRTGY